MDDDRYLYPPLTLVILIGAAIGYLVAGLTGVVVAAVAVYSAMMRRQMIRRKRALRRCAVDAEDALIAALVDAPGLADALRALHHREPDSRYLPVAAVLAELLQSPDRPGPGHISSLNIGDAALFRRFSAVEHVAANVFGGPNTLIVVPAARRRWVWPHVIPFTRSSPDAPVSVCDALEGLKCEVWKGSVEAADEISQQIEALIQPQHPDIARWFADEIGSYRRGFVLLDALRESKAIVRGPIRYAFTPSGFPRLRPLEAGLRGLLRSWYDSVFDAQVFMAYLGQKGWLGLLQNTEAALRRGAETGAVVGWRADALKSPPLRLGEPLTILGLIVAGTASGFLAAGFTGAAVGGLAAVWVTIWVNS